MTCFPFVRGARRLLFASTCLTLLACRRGHSPPTTAGARLPQTPVASTLPALPTPASATVALAVPELGTFGDLEIRTTASSTIVGVRDGDGSFRAHAPIAVASVGKTAGLAEWLLVLADSGLFLLEGDTLAVRARLFATASGDVAASNDGASFAFGACETGTSGDERCGVDVRAFPDLHRIRFVETDAPARIRWSDDGSELAIASRKDASVTVVGVATGKLERWTSTGAVNDACFLGTDAIAYGDDDDTTRVLDRATGRVLLDHLALIGHRVRRDQNTVAYDAAHDRLYTGGNDNDVWRYDAPRAGGRGVSAKALPITELANDVSDFTLRPNGDLVVALDSGSLDLVHPSGTSEHLLGASVGSVSYGARIAAGRDDDVVGVLGAAVFRWKFGEPHVRQSPLFGRFERTSPLPNAPGYVRIFGSDSMAWIPTGGDPLKVTLFELGAERGDCWAVHDGLVCFRDEPVPVLRGAPAGKGLADLPLPARVTGPFKSFAVVDGWGVAIDSALRVVLVDAHGARLFGRLPRGSRTSGAIAHDAKTDVWTIDGKAILPVAAETADATADGGAPG